MFEVTNNPNLLGLSSKKCRVVSDLSSKSVAIGHLYPLKNVGLLVIYPLKSVAIGHLYPLKNVGLLVIYPLKSVVLGHFYPLKSVKLFSLCQENSNVLACVRRWREHVMWVNGHAILVYPHSVGLSETPFAHFS